MFSSFGTLFRVTTFGESHGRAVGAVVDGCPAGLDLRLEDIQAQLDRRRPGQSDLTTSRQEGDRVAILSGVEKGRTLGTPITLVVQNLNQRPGDYSGLRAIPRPSHADYTYQLKYGTRAASGGGRASARETVGRVAAGVVAEQLLKKFFSTAIVAWVEKVGPIKAGEIDREQVSRSLVDRNPVRCPDEKAAAQMAALIGKAKESGDSVGGVITCACRNVPAGLGEPVFGKLEAILAQAMLSIPASKGFEIGSGFAGAAMNGSDHNDPFVFRDGRLRTLTNFSGGIQGGISNGETIYFRVAFKPPATIGKAQETVDFEGRPVVLEPGGRHDPCVVPRAVPIVEAMASLVLADLALVQAARSGLAGLGGGQ